MRSWVWEIGQYGDRQNPEVGWAGKPAEQTECLGLFRCPYREILKSTGSQKHDFQKEHQTYVKSVTWQK